MQTALLMQVLTLFPIADSNAKSKANTTDDANAIADTNTIECKVHSSHDDLCYTSPKSPVGSKFLLDFGIRSLLLDMPLSLHKSIQDLLRIVQFRFIIGRFVEHSPGKPLSEFDSVIGISRLVKVVENSRFQDRVPILVKEVLIHFEEFFVSRALLEGSCQPCHDILDDEGLSEKADCPSHQDAVLEVMCYTEDSLSVVPPLPSSGV